MFVDKGDYFELEEFKSYGVKAFYTTRDFGDFSKKGEIERVKNILAYGEKIVYTGHQTHSDNIAIIEGGTAQYIEDNDGFITDRKDVVIVTKYADCLPIYLLDIEKKVYGCVHSGWQGSYKEIVKKALEIMENKYKSKKLDIKVALGIGISTEKYEVGREFEEKFREKFSEGRLKGVFIEKNEKIYFDNKQFNINLLLEYGIKIENIITNNLCTYSDERFHSYRRDREESGRNAAYIYIDSDI